MLLSGTTLEDLSSGFLCVIWEGSTFFKPDVTDPPRFRSARRAPGPGRGTELDVEAEGAGADGGGRGAAVEIPTGMDEGAGAPCWVR